MAAVTVKDDVLKLLQGSIERAKADGIFTEDVDAVDVKLEYPKDSKFGDYATPFAMESARILRKSPMEIGEKIIPYLKEDYRIGIVEVLKPGFVNIFISETYLFSILKTIIAEKDGFGKRIKANPRRVILEFVSANPTGPLNIVSARAAAVGDTIANILEFNGDIVDREFYVNDYGNQVDLLGKSVLARYRELKGIDHAFPEDGYHGEYVRDIARHLEENHSGEINKLNGEDEMLAFFSEQAVRYNVEAQKRDLENFNVRFRNWFSEKKLHENNDVGVTLERLESLNVVYPEEGKKFFRSTDYGDDKDRVIVRDDGRPTYLMADITYHYDKIMRGYDLIINIWGPDHHGYITRLRGAVQALGFNPDNFKILIAQQVNLLMEGETVKMSKRLGNFSTMDELIDEIGVDVARYFFTMRSLESHLDFDLALAKKESSENPVFYLQYAHARICSIFRKAQELGFVYKPDLALPEYLNNEEVVSILKLLMKFPEEVSDAAEKYEPHRIPTYLMRLAQAFHKFYTDHRVLSDDPGQRNSYMALADAVRIIMSAGLAILGVSAPEQM